eukprot:m.355653 g.355653  ORF g.355653 m.355653 type:complete len:211 (-) comp17298_c0_seq1:174-806(-)
MMKLFGKKEAPPPPSLMSAIEKLDTTIDLMDKRVEADRKKCTTLASQIKATPKGRKRQVLLQKFSLIKSNMQKTEGMMANLENQKFAVQSATLTQQMVSGMETANQALVGLGIDPDNLADRVADIQDTMANLEDAQSELSQPMFQQMDDEEMEDMFAEFMEEEGLADDDALADDLAGLDLPDAPVAAPDVPVAAPQQSREQAEMAELAGW